MEQPRRPPDGQQLAEHGVRVRDVPGGRHERRVGEQGRVDGLRGAVLRRGRQADAKVVPLHCPIQPVEPVACAVRRGRGQAEAVHAPASTRNSKHVTPEPARWGYWEMSASINNVTGCGCSPAPNGVA